MPEAAGLPAAAARLRHGAERVGHRTCVEHMTMMHGRLPSPLCLPSECSELRREGAWGQRTARRRRAGGRRGGEIEPLQRRGRHGAMVPVRASNVTTLVAEGTRPGLAAVLSPLATADLPIPPHISPYLPIPPHISPYLPISPLATAEHRSSTFRSETTSTPPAGDMGEIWGRYGEINGRYGDDIDAARGKKGNFTEVSRSTTPPRCSRPTSSRPHLAKISPRPL